MPSVWSLIIKRIALTEPAQSPVLQVVPVVCVSDRGLRLGLSGAGTTSLHISAFLPISFYGRYASLWRGEGVGSPGAGWSPPTRAHPYPRVCGSEVLCPPPALLLLRGLIPRAAADSPQSACADRRGTPNLRLLCPDSSRTTQPLPQEADPTGQGGAPESGREGSAGMIWNGAPEEVGLGGRLKEQRCPTVPEVPDCKCVLFLLIDISKGDLLLFGVVCER